MRILIVEDDFISRKVLMKYLAPYGECDIAVNGNEAVQAFNRAMAENDSYQLICLDIMMPEMDGQEVLKIIRKKEDDEGVLPRNEVKIIMTTALQSPKDVFDAYSKGGCTSYLTKPLERKVLIKHLEELGLAGN
jgi:two-component system, chemotaxis family, chemotaxis protein CheY